MALWPHLVRTLGEIRQAISEGHTRICIASPTGSGKTALAAEILRSCAERGGTGIFMVHRTEIVLDARERLRKLGLDVGVVAPGHAARPFSPIHCCSTQTLIKRPDILPADLTVIVADEFHHYAETVTWTQIFARFPRAILVGLSATPSRGDNAPLDGVVTKLIVGAQYSELIAQGRIVPCKVLVPAKELDEENHEIAQSPVTAYLQHTPGKRGFVFTKTVAHAEALKDEFCAASVPSAVISAKTKKRDRKRYMDQMRAGELMLLVSVMTLTEGIDIADAEVCVLVRNPEHVGSYLQMVGRVLRASPGKTHAVLLDLFGTSKKAGFGLPDSDREYRIDGGGAAISGGMATKQCPGCGAQIIASSKICQWCSHEFGGDGEESARSLMPVDAKVGLVEHSVSVADRLKTLDPLFRACMISLRETGAPILWALQKFKAEHAKDGIPRELLALVSQETRKKAYDQAMSGMLKSAQWKGKLARFGYGAALLFDVFGTWPPKSWTDPWREEYARVELLLKGRVA